MGGGLVSMFSRDGMVGWGWSGFCWEEEGEEGSELERLRFVETVRICCISSSERIFRHCAGGVYPWEEVCGGGMLVE